MSKISGLHPVFNAILTIIVNNIILCTRYDDEVIMGIISGVVPAHLLTYSFITAFTACTATEGSAKLVLRTIII